MGLLFTWVKTMTEIKLFRTVPFGDVGILTYYGEIEIPVEQRTDMIKAI